MEKSKVYFINMRTKIGESLLTKMDRMLSTAGFDTLPLDRKFTAVKVHFGEPGNLACLRPAWAKVVVDRIKKIGGMPFLTDCNTLYVGRRNNALLHLDAAAENGWNYETTGARIIIADGLRGTDFVDLPVPNGEACTEAHVGRALADADAVISLTHFKVHEQSGVGGVIKNIGMGGGSRAGKMHMHNDGKPHVIAKKCVGCKVCSKFCNQDAFAYTKDADGKLKASIDHNKCVGCGRCMGACNYNAIDNSSGNAVDTLNRRMVEYTAAILAGKPHFHICVVNQVSPYCDCHNESDAAVVPDIGVFCGFDPIAVDRACAEAVLAAPRIHGTILDERKESGDIFADIHPITNWTMQTEHGEKIGLGSGSYEIVTVA
jgi:uncharacterized Fe-S center protein